ncbi:uncharacterized protein An11g00900 [Aspergillus niger]|uniref:Contig An11c0040, genomic contig n=2 Tax=Aspergillus niger TaxID=5061 RepID=A2QVC4_ASPNC|nr:uncharacterized protein An11g00900 [Aspergillus niger]CAK96881.1 unnamed protein product [Aspergillus niger]
MNWGGDRVKVVFVIGAACGSLRHEASFYGGPLRPLVHVSCLINSEPRGDLENPSVLEHAVHARQNYKNQRSSPHGAITSSAVITDVSTWGVLCYSIVSNANYQGRGATPAAAAPRS